MSNKKSSDILTQISLSMIHFSLSDFKILLSFHNLIIMLELVSMWFSLSLSGLESVEPLDVYLELVGLCCHFC